MMYLKKIIKKFFKNDNNDTTNIITGIPVVNAEPLLYANRHEESKLDDNNTSHEEYKRDYNKISSEESKSDDKKVYEKSMSKINRDKEHIVYPAAENIIQTGFRREIKKNGYHDESDYFVVPKKWYGGPIETWPILSGYSFSYIHLNIIAFNSLQKILKEQEVGCITKEINQFYTYDPDFVNLKKLFERHPGKSFVIVPPKK